MASRTILHVGTMKSGTSHIQGRLFANRAALAEAGILVPGARWPDQGRAVADLLRIQRRGPHKAQGDWQRIADAIAAHPGTAVISMEFLGPATPEEIAGIRAALPDEVEAVVTVRDLNRTLAAMWQETLQNGSIWDYREYLESAEKGRPGVWTSSEPPPKPGRPFWRQQDVVRMARDWRAEMPVTLITLPPPGGSRTLLWERFCQVLGVPPTGWAEGGRSNESIGAASAILLRRLNLALVEAGQDTRAARRIRKHYLAKQVLAGHKQDEPPIGLPVAPWVAEHAARTAEELRRLDLTRIGDLDELAPVPVPGIDPRDVDSQDVIAAAVAGLAGMVRRIGEEG